MDSWRLRWVWWCDTRVLRDWGRGVRRGVGGRVDWLWGGVRAERGKRGEKRGERGKGKGVSIALVPIFLFVNRP